MKPKYLESLLLTDFPSALLAGPLRAFLMLCVVLDLVLIVIYVFLGFQAVQSGAVVGPLWDLPFEESVASYWNYLKLLISVAALLVAARFRGETGFALFALAVAVLLLDDYFELHDRVAWFVGGYLGDTAFGEVHQQSRGEPIVFALFGMLVLGIMVVAYRKTSADNISNARALVLTLLLFAFFATAVDMAHGFSELIATSSQRVLSGVFNVLEEGGESMALSVLLTLCLWLAAHPRGSGVN